MVREADGQYGDRSSQEIQAYGIPAIGADTGEDTGTSERRGGKGSKTRTDPDGRGASGNQKIDI